MIFELTHVLYASSFVSSFVFFDAVFGDAGVVFFFYAVYASCVYVCVDV